MGGKSKGPAPVEKKKEVVEEDPKPAGTGQRTDRLKSDDVQQGATILTDGLGDPGGTTTEKKPSTTGVP